MVNWVKATLPPPNAAPTQANGYSNYQARYPGGGYSDNCHWSTYKSTKWQGSDPPKYGYYAANNDFGHFVSLMDQVGTTVITVNYGSNFDGTGGGEPAEAAAWVAYGNGNPADTRPIGKDSTGHDWQTVGYWASLLAARPLASDDGKNFLRIGHPQGLNVKYWEIGNEVFGNGYYGGEGEPPRRRPDANRAESCSALRFLLVEAAQVTVRSIPEWRSQYFHLAMRRGRKIAKVAMARRLAVQMFWMLRKGWDYEQVKRFGSHAGQPGHRDGVK